MATVSPIIQPETMKLRSEDLMMHLPAEKVETSEPSPVHITASQAPSVVKPIAMKVLRPIPQKASEQFYNEAYQQGLNLRETSEAAALAHDWHRKWTQQDEENHTMPHADFYASRNGVPQHYAFDVDRNGAMNPLLGYSDSESLETEDNVKRTFDRAIQMRGESADEHEIVFCPEDRLSASSYSDASTSSSLSSYIAPQTKRRFVVEDERVDSHVIPDAVRPVVVRPSAVRPQAMRPSFPCQPNLTRAQVPREVLAKRTSSISMLSDCNEPSDSSSAYMSPEKEVASPAVHVIEDDATMTSETASETASGIQTRADIELAKDQVLHALAASQGDVDTKEFTESLNPLLKYFSKKELDTRPHLIGNEESVDGMWLTLSKPSYFGCLGENDNGDPMYTLGRMSFDMFSPTNLVCSLQGNFNPVEIVSDDERKAMLDNVPKSLREEVEAGKTELRTYHIVAAFTVEPALAEFPNAPNKDVRRPIKGIMTTYGYSLPDPTDENRHSIWFTGGRIEPNDNAEDISEWKRLFTLHPPTHTWGEKAKLLAVKLLMGATIPEKMASDGSMEYVFTRPIGGHGMAYIDVIYLDETMRIVRGHRGTIFVFSRLPQKSVQ